MFTPEAIKSRLKALGVGPDKYLGQHFLINESVLAAIGQKLDEFLAENPIDIVVEVGPGLGVLTQLLTSKAQHVVAIERDPVFAQNLGEFIGKDTLTVIQGDALNLLETNPGFPVRFSINHFGKVMQRDALFSQIDDSVCMDSPGADLDWVFIANIPYGITSPLLRMLVNLEVPPRHILVLVQKEVAERLAAKPGNSNRGFLTVLMELVGETKVLMTVPPASFWPEPKVESALIHIDLTQPKVGLNESERKQLFKLLTAGFAGKRKQLLNSLAAGLGLTSQQTRELLEAAHIDPTRRAETLSLDEWITLAQKKSLS